MRLSAKQQHEKNTAAILGEKYTPPKQEDQHVTQAKKILAARGETIEVAPEVSKETKKDLMNLKKQELQDKCTAKDISFTDDDTKAQLVEKILTT